MRPKRSSPPVIPYYNASSDPEAQMKALHDKAGAYLNLGQEQKAIDIYQNLLTRIPLGYDDQRLLIMKDLALAYMRMGERMNCIQNHSAESCIFPISQAGVHMDKTGSEKAIELYKKILASDRNDLESRWLLNIAYMTTGGYPQDVPPQYLLKISNDDSMHMVKPS